MADTQRVIYCSPDWERKGGTLWPISRLLQTFGNVKCETYTRQKKGVYLGHNTLDETVSKRMRRVVFLGGARPGDHGIPRDFNWNKADHCVFISNFFRKIAKSRYDIPRSSAIHLVGGSPHDMDMVPKPPFTQSLSPADEIHFMICAKWRKRYFKRYKQHLMLFDRIKKEYPNAKLHILGTEAKKINEGEGGIIGYPKNFHDDTCKNVYQKAHIHLILTPFDTGPMTVNESLHYRVPFICGNNSAAGEFISMVDGTPGIVVKIDPQIKTASDCKKYKPMKNRKFYNRIVDFDLVMQSVREMVANYSTYVSWTWTEEFNYQAQCKKWLDVLFC